MPQDKTRGNQKQPETQPTKEPIAPKRGDVSPDIAEPVQQPAGDRKKSEGTGRTSDELDRGQA
jgi:hypothetical protein